MNCTSVADNLSAYLDGELEPELLAQVQEHLNDCQACRAELETLRTTTGLVGSLPMVKAPASLLEGVQDHLARKALLKASQIEPTPTHGVNILAVCDIHAEGLPETARELGAPEHTRAAST